MTKEQVYELNDTLAAYMNTHQLLDWSDPDEADARLNEAVWAVVAIVERED